VISVDTKKKELVGDLKNNGRELRPKGPPRQPQPGIERPAPPLSRTRVTRTGPQRRKWGSRASSRLGQGRAHSGGTRSLDQRRWLIQAAGVSSQAKSRSSFQTRCRITASLQATATVARCLPMRAASASPQVLSLQARGTRVSRALAASKGNCAGARRRIWRCGHIDLARRVASRRQAKIGANRA